MRVSVIMPSYRHGAYIAQAIDSVLSQTVEDIELIIVDDASPDNSNDVIRGFSDRRILHIALPANVGASEAMNIGLRRASSPLIAVCNSDDVWAPAKLQLQLDILERMPNLAAVFSDVTWIDQCGEIIIKKASDIFSQENRPRHAWLKQLIERGNCFCHPSVLIRRTVYETCGYYDSYLRQLPDYDMWLRLLQRYDIHVMSDRLVHFRIHAGNTSRLSPQAYRRMHRERHFILRKLFEEITDANFRRALLGDDSHVPEGKEEALADPRAVLAYLRAYEGPRKDIFQDIMLERLYRAGPEIREATLSVHAFQAAMEHPCPPFMGQCTLRDMARRLLGRLQRKLTASWHRSYTSSP